MEKEYGKIALEASHAHSSRHLSLYFACHSNSLRPHSTPNSHIYSHAQRVRSFNWSSGTDSTCPFHSRLILKLIYHSLQTRASRPIAPHLFYDSDKDARLVIVQFWP